MARTAALDARRAQLLAIGKQIFSARPYDAVSTEEIAAEAGISVGLLYHYFANKKGFYVATIRAAADDLLAAARFPPGLSLPEAAPTVLGSFVDFVEVNSALYQGLMRGGVGADSEVHTILEEVRVTFMTRVFDAAGVAPTPTLRLQLYGWLGLVEFSSLRWLTHREVGRDELLGLLLAAVPSPLLEVQA
jgi:AcrR family transcriptional regulator